MTEDKKIELGKFLKSKRNMSMKKLSELVFEKTGKKITQSSICNYENGRREPKLETVSAICETLKIDKNYIIKKFMI